MQIWSDYSESENATLKVSILWDAQVYAENRTSIHSSHIPSLLTNELLDPPWGSKKLIADVLHSSVLDSGVPSPRRY